jgi:hypothetical protein
MGLEELGALDNEESGAKATEVADEVFRENQKKTQATQRAMKKAEDSARKKDGQLAKVIGRFLQTHSNTAVMLLIARCLEQNIPAGFILGILALVELEAREEFEALLGEAAVKLLDTPQQEEEVNTHALTASELPSHVKRAIDAWAEGLFAFGMTQPIRLLTTASSSEGELFPSLVQLTAFILEQYLAGEKVTLEHENAREFGKLILRNLLEKIENQVSQTGELAAGKD